jgi:hypothetical protein
MSIPETIFCSLVSATLAGLLVGWRAYYWGLRSQAVAAKRESRVAVIAMIDRIGTDILASQYSPEMAASIHSKLKGAVFDFEARLKRRGQGRIQWAWSEYEKKTGGNLHPALSVENLIQLRDEISAA